MSLIDKIILTVVIGVSFLVTGTMHTDAAGKTYPVSLLPTEEWKTHNVKPLSPTRFKVTGSDPYIISPVLNRPLSDIAGVYLQLAVQTQLANVDFQIFFSTDRQGYGQNNSFKFTVETVSGGKRIFIPFAGHLGESFRNETLQTIRLDFMDGCSGCVFEVLEADLLDQVSMDMADLIPGDLVYPVIQKSVLPDIAQKNAYTLHDLKLLSSEAFEVSGDDPHILFSDLNVLANRVTGIHFRMSFSNSKARECRMQLFWSTYVQGFDEKKSFRFCVIPDQGPVEFVIPLAVLPKAEMLKTIRLDFDSADISPIQLLDARLIGTDIQSMRHLVPQKIVYSSGKNIYGMKTLSHVLMRITSDRWFLVFYAALLVSMACAIVAIHRNRGVRV
ncbi:MAG: hypothetical protein AB7S77_07320 [Desulfatirhabdiaceae bacterium]